MLSTSTKPETHPAGNPLSPARAKLRRAQPLSALDVPGGLLTLETVCKLTGLSETTIHKLRKTGDFFEPVTVPGTRAKRYPADQLREWLQARGLGKG